MGQGHAPLFTSAPRIKLKIDGTDVAYAIGFNVNIAIDVQPVQVIGQYQVASLEPTIYNVVTGTIQVIKLAPQDALANLSTEQNKLIANPDQAVTTDQNVTSTGNLTERKTNSVLSNEGLFAHLDPARVLASRAFNMQVYMRMPTIDSISTLTSAKKPAENDVTLEEFQWLTVKNCRIVSRNVNITQGQLVNEPVNFQGLLATPESSTESPDVQSFSSDTGTTSGPAT